MLANDSCLWARGHASGRSMQHPHPSGATTPSARHRVAAQVLKQHGVERYDPLGQPFDPNLHNALFDVPDTTKEHNTVAMVTKVG